MGRYAGFIASALAIIAVTFHPTGSTASTRFVEDFDGQPPQVRPVHPDGLVGWDTAVHSRDVETWDELTSTEAHHGAHCEAPGHQGDVTHLTSTYEGAVFHCKDHVMTTINAAGYGLIYLTPDHMVDFSTRGTVRFDMSTLKSSGRDWVDIWIQPFQDNVQLPFHMGDVDLQDQPRDAIHIVMPVGDEHGFQLNTIRDGRLTGHGPEFPADYRDVLSPSAQVRSTFEVVLSPNRVKFWLPDHNLVFFDEAISVDFTVGTVQLGHHSYNPRKGDVGGGTTPNTWHWDTVTIDPAVPFTMINTDRRRVVEGDANTTLTFDSAAPANSFLRFSGQGRIEVSFDSGPFAPARFAPTTLHDSDGHGHNAGHHASYWHPVPAGARSVTFRFEDDDWWELDKQVKDVRVWAANGASSRSVSPPPPSLVGGPLVHAGTAPSAGLALLTTSTDTTPQTLAASLVTDGCAWPRFAVTQQGRWHTYVAGAPAFVNLGFPSTLAAGTPFSVRC